MITRYLRVPGVVPRFRATTVLAVAPLSCFLSSLHYVLFAARLHSSSLPAACQPCPGGSSHQGTEGPERTGRVAVQMGSDPAQVVRQKLTHKFLVQESCLKLPFSPLVLGLTKKKFVCIVSQVVALKG